MKTNIMSALCVCVCVWGGLCVRACVHMCLCVCLCVYDQTYLHCKLITEWCSAEYDNSATHPYLPHSGRTAVGRIRCNRHKRTHTHTHTLSLSLSLSQQTQKSDTMKPDSLHLHILRNTKILLTFNVKCV